MNFDTSIDDDIRRQYNPSKLEQDTALPALPKILDGKEDDVIPQKVMTKKVQSQPLPISKISAQQKPKAEPQTVSTAKIAKGSQAVLKSRTKIRVKGITGISDRTKKGTKLSFVSKYPVSTTYFTIPMGTTFYGEISDSHRPQLTGNGGLISIKITSMSIRGENYPINGYISKANYKNIFFNNIKGERRYMKSMAKSTKPGRHFFSKMMRVTSNLAGDGSSVILSPFSILFGVVTVGANTLAAPVLAIFYKGGSIYIPEGADFEIRLGQDAYIFN